MKRGETGAVNSAKHSEVLVHRRTGKQVSKSRHINARSAAHRSKHQTSNNCGWFIARTLLGQALHQSTKESHTDVNVRLHAWSTRFHLGLVLGQITCLTAGSNEPRASQRVTTWEDHSPHARNVQHSDSEDRVSHWRAFKKRPRELLLPYLPPRGRHQRQHVRHSTPETAHRREQSKTCCMDGE